MKIPEISKYPGFPSPFDIMKEVLIFGVAVERGKWVRTSGVDYPQARCSFAGSCEQRDMFSPRLEAPMSVIRRSVRH